MTGHLRRYRFFYAAGAVWLAVVVALPTVAPTTGLPTAALENHCPITSPPRHPTIVRPLGPSRDPGPRARSEWG